MFLLKPTFYFKKVTDIHCSFLEKIGIKMVLLDIDNTLAVPDSMEVFSGVLEWIGQMKSKNFQLMLVSNNQEERVNLFSKYVGIPGIFWAKKPLPFKVKKIVNCKPSEVIMIGDQILTDILLANLIGMRSVLLDPQVKDPDLFSFRWLKIQFENMIKRTLF